MAGRQPHALIGPRRFRIPLLGQLDPERAAHERRGQAKARDLAHGVRGGPGQEVDDVDLAGPERGRPRRLLGHGAHHQALHRRRLAPVAVEGLQHDLDARLERDDLVRPGADGRRLEPVVADFLDVFLRHDPAGARRRGAIEGDEIRPRLAEDEAHLPGVEDLHLLDLVLEQLGAGALVPVPRELHVVRGHRLTVVEAGALAQHERVREMILGLRPRLGQARRGDSRRHRFHHSVVDRVHDHEGRVERLRLRGIEPAGGEGHVETPAHLARRRLAALRVSAHRVGEDEDAQDYTEQHAVTSAGASRGAHRQSTTAITSTSTRRSGWASRRTSTVVLVGSAPKYSMRTSVCLKNSSISVT